MYPSTYIPLSSTARALKETSNNSGNSEIKSILEAVFKNSIDGILTINKRGIVETLNPAAAALFGYAPEEVIGQNIKMLMPEPFHSRHDQYLTNYDDTQQKKIIGIGREVPGRRKDGSIFPFFLSVSEVKLTNRTIYAGFIHDISEIKRKEVELLASKNKLQAVFHTAVDGIIIIDVQGLIQMVNPAAARIFGYTPAELLGKNVRILMPSPHHEQHDGYLKNYRQTRKPKIIGIGREVDGKKKDGTIFPISLGVSEIKMDNTSNYAGVIHDLTLQKEAENKIKTINEELENRVQERTEELSGAVNKLLKVNRQLEKEVAERKIIAEALKKSQEELENALEAEKKLGELKTRFVSMASHEFRTPLSTILSSASLIGRYTEGDQQAQREKHINRIKSAVNNLTGILSDFLSLSRLEEGRITTKIEVFEWHSFCEEVMEELKGMLKKDQQIIHTGIAEKTTVQLDRHHLKNILMNLLSNAIKYSKIGQTIFCRSKIEDGQIWLEVEDQGIGIPTQDQQHLFDRFFRAKNVTAIQGTGLGLNITRRYVQLLNGSIRFESEEGKGSTFYVNIPLVD